MLGFVPALFSEGLGATFCPDAPFPHRFVTVEGKEFTLARFDAGSGQALPLRGARPLSKSPVPSLPRASWDGHAPPSDPGSAFPWGEALAWLHENSTRFNAFVTAHPAYHLHSTYILGSSGSRLGPETDASLLETRSDQREISVQGPSGESMTFRLEKSRDLLGATTILEQDARRGQGPVSLQPSELPREHFTPQATMADYLTVVRGTPQDVQALTALAGVGGKTETTRTFYVYRVLVRPESTAPDAFQYFPYTAHYRSDTGERLQYLLPMGTIETWVAL